MEKTARLSALCLGFSVIVLMAWGCASTRKVKAPSRKNPKLFTNFEQMDERFDPTTLNDEDIIIEETQGRGSAVEDILASSSETAADSVVTGYRVQLIQTSDPEEAREVQKGAILRFDADVYRVFDAPFYKVRVGDFVNWYDAQKLQKVAIAKGYREAWVIRTKINLKNAKRWE
ncbi:MAG: SPOR domain-containing protein [bacterium]